MDSTICMVGVNSEAVHRCLLYWTGVEANKHHAAVHGPDLA